VNGLDTPCSELDTVTVLNVALPGVVFFVQRNPVLAPHADALIRALNILISLPAFKDQLFHEVTVKEFLFDGYSRGTHVRKLETENVK
jgi:hypothetical protein